MGLIDIITSRRKILAFVSLGCIGGGLIAVFLTSLIWWSRIHPWFGYGYGSGFKVYQAVAVCWSLSLIAIICFLVIIVIGLFVKPLRDQINSSFIAILSIIVIGALLITSASTGLYASSYALESKNFGIDDQFYYYRCYHGYPAEAMTGISIYFGWYCDDEEPTEHLDQLEKYSKWIEKFASKIMVDDTNYTNYICIDVGMPIIIFAALEFLGIILFIIAAYPFITSSDDNSAKENDAQ